ncbi:senescence-specific cysteine protease sag39 [Cucumis melo var. makuwa]|uniref:Senescence-specific cysteine protease sag39 n=1 Tax=Cucumis melo var. makuwa TaxID=1194695 RepID=A0A5A7T250_CUCMM|nr:senescence-specific cysteine protease sag39 [Cucumis melo var. makuwa]TYK31074.1 senescence-specific cysteine protease sag39 [Cucumis melo var. makuwa]
MKVINGMSEDFRAALDVLRSNPVSRIKIFELNPFCGARDAKALENFIFDLEQYFKATNTVTEEAKVTLATMHLAEDAKLWWRSRYSTFKKGIA